MNKSFTAIIIDDEKGSIDALEWELKKFSDDLHIVYATQSPSDGITHIRKLKPDVVFLDISMPEMTGFELLEAIRDIQFHVVFTTAFDHYAIEAFKENAIDYLLKPVLPEDLMRVIRKMKTVTENHNLQEKLQSFLNEYKQLNNGYKTVALPTMEGLEFVDIEDIVRCESTSNYTYIHLLREKPILISKTLKEVESMLTNHGFIRIHQSHLVNIKSIKKYIKGKAGSLILKDGSIIPVSRSKKGDFLNNF